MESKKSRNCGLPEEIFIHEILPKLPTKSVIRFKCVSKTWLSLISQHSSLIAANHTAGEEEEEPGTIISVPYSIYYERKAPMNGLFFLGHNQSSFVKIDTSYVYKKKKNPDYFVPIGSCNGLVCLKLLYPDETHDLVLWNPATREVNYLPTPTEAGWSGKYALGYHDRSDVKVLRVQKDGGLLDAQIFKKSGHWRNLKSSEVIPDFVREGDGLSIDGAIYWEFTPFNIHSFDMSLEVFREIDPPQFIVDQPLRSKFSYALMRWKGSLGYAYVRADGAEIQVWLKNKDCDDCNGGWTKISTIQPSLGPIFVRGAFNDQIILKRDFNHSEVVWDLAANKRRQVGRGSLKKLRGCSHICEHVYTLISPY